MTRETPSSPGAPEPANVPAASNGNAVRFRCAVVPGDLAEVQRTSRGAVQVAVREGSAAARVILTPRAARAYAAALLNAADSADGTVPLVFTPPAA